MTEQEAKTIISSYGAPGNIGRLRGLGKRGYDEIMAVLGRQDPARQESKGME